MWEGLFEPGSELGLDLVLTMHSTVYSGVLSFVRSFSLSSFVCLKHAVLCNETLLLFLCLTGYMINLVILHTEMYCRVGFEAHPPDQPPEDLELSEIVPPETNREGEVPFGELAVSSVKLLRVTLCPRTRCPRTTCPEQWRSQARAQAQAMFDCARTSVSSKVH